MAKNRGYAEVHMDYILIDNSKISKMQKILEYDKCTVKAHVFHSLRSSWIFRTHVPARCRESNSVHEPITDFVRL